MMPCDGLQVSWQQIVITLTGVDLLHCGRFFREHLSDALDLRSHAPKFFFDVFVPAIDVIDAVDDGFAVGD